MRSFASTFVIDFICPLTPWCMRNLVLRGFRHPTPSTFQPEICRPCEPTRFCPQILCAVARGPKATGGDGVARDPCGSPPAPTALMGDHRCERTALGIFEPAGTDCQCVEHNSGRMPLNSGVGHGRIPQQSQSSLRLWFLDTTLGVGARCCHNFRNGIPLGEAMEIRWLDGSPPQRELLSTRTEFVHGLS